MIDLDRTMQVFATEGVDITADYFTLRGHQVSTVLDCMRHDHYRAPRNSPGSAARMYWYAIQRKHRALSKQ